MPNWCECELTVRGPAQSVAAFREAARGPESELDENRFLPYPEQFKQQDEAAAKHAKQRDEAIEALIQQGVSRDAAWKQVSDQMPHVSDGYNSGGYEWCIANWGTKWGLGEVDRLSLKTAKGQTIVKYAFMTAWSPPVPIIQVMAKAHPRLVFTLKYYEGGMGFAGTFAVRGETVLKDLHDEAYRGRRGG